MTNNGLCRIGVDCPRPVYCEWVNGHCIPHERPYDPMTASKPLGWDDGVIPEESIDTPVWVGWVQAGMVAVAALVAVMLLADVLYGPLF